jgi:asparagine synthase (glutamine-hydrolysing)
LQEFLEFGYVFGTGNTILEGVRKLEPGHRIEVRDGAITHEQAWFVPASVPSEQPPGTAGVQAFMDTLEEVVAQHLVADVPVGLLLSGGLDSSLIASLAARKGPLLTISMGFSKSALDERPYARTVSEHLGSRHVDVEISAAEVQKEISEGAWVFDDLFADWGTVTTRLLYRRCRELGVKVVLVGEGSDELFGGYDIFRVPERLGVWQQFRLYQKYAGRRHGKLFGRFREIMGQYLEQTHGNAFEAVRLFESRRQLPNNYVMKVDKASMAESVEARAPFLDRRIAQIAYATPRSALLRGDENKHLLRAGARLRGLLPESITSRPKLGGSIAASWMADDTQFRHFARERLLDGRWTAQLGLRNQMRDFFDKGVQGGAFPAALSLYGNMAWRLLLLELWSGFYLAPR